MAEKFIQKAIKHPGALHRQLGVPQGKKIPSSYISKIKDAKVGSKVSIGGKSLTVTPQLKKRAVLGSVLVKLNK